MARVLLGSNENFTISNDDVSVFGMFGSGVETATLTNATKGIIIDQNVEQVILSGSSQEYSFKQAGNGLQIYKTDSSTPLATILVQGGIADVGKDGTLLTFTNGTANAMLSSTHVMTLGNIPVSPTTAGTVNPASLITYSLSGSDHFTESLMTPYNFTITASAPVSKAETLRYNIVGEALGGIMGNATTADISPASSLVTFNPGETTKTVSINVLYDGITEGLEGVRIDLFNSSFAIIASKKFAVSDAISYDIPYITVDHSGYDSASRMDYSYSIKPGAYTHTIDGFGVHDKLFFPNGNSPSVNNIDLADGRVDINWTNPTNQNTVTISLIGLTEQQDRALNVLNDLNTVFGAGTYL